MPDEIKLVRLQSAKPPYHYDTLNGMMPAKDGREARSFRIEFDDNGMAVTDDKLGEYVTNLAKGHLRMLPAQQGDQPTFTDPTKLLRSIRTSDRRRGTLSVTDVPELRKLNQNLTEEERKRMEQTKEPEPEFDETPAGNVMPAAQAASAETALGMRRPGGRR